MEILSLSGEGGARPVSGSHEITALKPALRQENRVNVFVDDKFAFSLDIVQVVELGVKVGRTLSAEELVKLNEASEFGKIYQRALEWALVRPRSVAEARDYLKNRQARRRTENRLRDKNRERSKEEQQRYHLKTKKLGEISDGQIELVLRRLTERGYVDDEKFARHYVENRFVKKGVSRRRLELELKNKGVSTEITVAVLGDGARSDEEEIRKIIARKVRRYGPEKLIQYLTRQGFDYQLSQSLVREMDSQSWE